MRLAPCLVALLAIAGMPSIAGEAGGPLPSPPFVVACGPRGEAGDRVGERGGLRVMPDRRFADGAAYGFAGGEAFRRWSPAIWGRRDAALFSAGRVDPGSYSFRLPPGEYAVALGFCETAEHAAGRRAFDVEVGGREATVDAFAIAGFGGAFRLVFPARAEGDGSLTIRFRRRPGLAPPFVNAIWIYPRPADRRPPAPPALRGSGSYGANVLFWDLPEDEPLAGCIVERRGPGEAEFAARTAAAVPVPRWIDGEVRPGARYEYRIRAVDAGGRAGDPSPPIALGPRSLDAAPLPVYRIDVAPESLAPLLADVRGDREASGTFRYHGESYPIRLRLHGGSSRNAAKASWRVRFPTRSPFPRRTIVLKAEPHDFTLQQEKLSHDVFASLGLPASEVRYVELVLGGLYRGIYLEVEPIRKPFPDRAGLPPGKLIRSAGFQRVDRRAVPAEGKRAADTPASLAELIRQVNRVDRGETEALVRSGTDWPEVRDYLAAQVICHRTEIEANDFYYFRDAASGRWLLIPWDHNNGNFGVSGPSRSLGRPRVDLWGMSFQGVGGRHPWWYALPTRIFQDDALRRDYLDRLEELARRILVGGGIDALVDANFRALRDEAAADPFRWPPGEDGPFLGSAEALKAFAREHGRRLLRLIDAERRREPPPLAIDEFQFEEDRGWVEVRNVTASPVDLAGWSLGPIEGEKPPRLPLAGRDQLGPGERIVVPIERRRDAGEGSFPGFDPAGGTVGLFGPERSGCADFYFYGHRTPGFSYGRTAEGFGDLRPTPGGPNEPAGVRPPPVIGDGGVTWRLGRPHEARAVLTSLVPAGPIESIAVRYRAGARSGEAAMAIEEAGGGRRDEARAVAVLPDDLEPGEIRYWFLARAKGGLERVAPLTAPRETYAARQRPKD